MIKNFRILLLILMDQISLKESSSIDWNYKECTPSCSSGSKKNKINLKKI
jgi:hypothetical protein